MARANTETMLVQVEIFWGRQWTGSYYAETKGQGINVHVGEHWSNRREGGYSFSGCPLGRTTGMDFTSDEEAIEYAIQDFLRYGRPEYQGKQTLSRDMIVVVETRDYRK